MYLIIFALLSAYSLPGLVFACIEENQCEVAKIGCTFNNTLYQCTNDISFHVFIPNVIGNETSSDPVQDITLPQEGQQWYNKESGESYIYQNGIWQLLPCSPISCASDTCILSSLLQSGSTLVYNEDLISPSGKPGCWEQSARPIQSCKLNDNFGITRSGELITISVLDNDFGMLDPSTVTILDQPNHAYDISVNPANGEISYTSLNRYQGQDTFSYTVSNIDGNPCEDYATVYIDISCHPPDGLGPRFIYSSLNQVIEYNNGTETPLFTASVTVNALASNNDDHLIYWAEEQTIYAYDYIMDTEFVIVSNISEDNRFEPGDGSLSSGGATYYKGIYYVGGSNPNEPIISTGYYAIAFNSYIPGSFTQTLATVSWILYGDSISRDYGDMAFDPNTYVLYISSKNRGVDTFTSFHASTGTVIRTNSSPSNSIYQLTYGPDNVLVAVNDKTVVPINTMNGLPNPGYTFPDLELTAIDLADWICKSPSL